MAKSKSGGTRSYIRGRVGADVFSVGKDAKGSKQQVVRSLAEQVANPQTIDQMRGRMIMATVMQAVKALSNIIDHSFDGVPKGQPSISEFISRNYQLVKADVAAHPSGSNQFGLNAYHVKGLQNGAWLISNGTARLSSAVSFSNNDGIVITGTAQDTTLRNFMDLAGIEKGEYLTLVALTSEKKVVSFRISVKEDADETTVLATENITTLFEIEGNITLSPYLASNVLCFAFSDSSINVSPVGGIIVSKKTASGFKHSRLQWDSSTGPARPKADVVLPTYPIGTEMYLNGGDL